MFYDGGAWCPHKKKKNFKPHGVRVNPTNPTAFSPLGGPLCPHKEKKDLNPTAFSPLGGGAFVPTQEKKKDLNPTAFSPLGGLSAHTRKKKDFKETVWIP